MFIHQLVSPMYVAQLAAAILAQLSLPPAEVANAIEAFRKNHLQELQVRALPIELWPYAALNPR